jgi:hypothetical protein
MQAVANVTHRHRLTSHYFLTLAQIAMNFPSVPSAYALHALRWDFCRPSFCP